MFFSLILSPSWGWEGKCFFSRVSKYCFIIVVCVVTIILSTWERGGGHFSYDLIFALCFCCLARSSRTYCCRYSLGSGRETFTACFEIGVRCGLSWPGETRWRWEYTEQRPFGIVWWARVGKKKISHELSWQVKVWYKKRAERSTSGKPKRWKKKQKYRSRVNQFFWARNRAPLKRGAFKKIAVAI